MNMELDQQTIYSKGIETYLAKGIINEEILQVTYLVDYENQKYILKISEIINMSRIFKNSVL